MSDSSVEQIANKNSTVVEKYISKYRSNITKTINNNLSNLQGTDFSSIGVLNISDLGLQNIDLEGLGLDVFDFGSLAALGNLNLGTLGDLRNLNISSFAKLSGLNLADLAKIDGFGLDLNNIDLTNFLSGGEVLNFIENYSKSNAAGEVDGLINQANNILKDVTQQVNKIFDGSEKTVDEIASQATSYLSQVSGKVNEYQKQVDEIVDKTEELLKGAGNLNNPFESVGKSIEEALEKYNSVNLTGDWSKQLKNSLLDFVQEYIVNLISAILKEISKLCEGTSKSDFSNLGLKPPTLGNFPSDVTPVFPFVPNFLDEVITDNNVANDVGGYVGRPKEEVDEFIKELPELLTISEICSLFSEDSSRLTNDLIMDKVWSGLLSLSKYNELKNAIGSKGNLITVFAILAPFIDKEKCVATIKGLEDTKKILSQFCEPISNDAIVGELLEKASSEVVGEIIKKEDKTLEDLISNVKDVSDLANNFPPVFCGPEAELKQQKPIFTDSMHSSTKHLQNKQLSNIYKTITDIFEVDILNFKTILTNNISSVADFLDPAAKLKSFTNAGSEVAGAISSIYTLGDSVKDLPDKADEEYLVKKAAQTGIVAKRVRKVLEQINSQDNSLTNFRVESPEGGEEGKVVSLVTNYISNDKLSLSFNFSQQLYQNPKSQQTDIIPSRTVRLRVGNENNFVDYYTPLTENQDYTNIINNLFADASNTENEYDSAIQSHFNKNSNSLSFFTEIVSQIIKEHAEYITSKGLFERKLFNELKLNRKNACAASLLYTHDIFTDVEITSDNVQCLFGLDIVPTPAETAKISSFIKIYLRVITINEILKGIFVFGAYGFNALLATSPGSKSFDSFYLKYLKAQIKKQMYPAIFSATKTISLKQGFPDDVDFSKYLKIEYAANNNIKNINSVSDNEVFNELIISTISFVKDRMNKILIDAGAFSYEENNNPLSPSNNDQYIKNQEDSGFQEAVDDIESQEGSPTADEFDEQKILDDYSSYVFNQDFVISSMLRNLLKVDSLESSFENPSAQNVFSTILDPPPVISIGSTLSSGVNSLDEFKFSNSLFFTVPQGYYTSKNNGRLKNGGFFLEQGFEVSNVFKDDAVMGHLPKPFNSNINDVNSDYNLIHNALSDDPGGQPSGFINGFLISTPANKFTKSDFEAMVRGTSDNSGPENASYAAAGKFLMGSNYEFAPAPFNELNLGELNSELVSKLAENQGRINFTKFNDLYASSIEDYVDTLSGFIEEALKRTTDTTKRIRLTALKNNNLFYKKFNGYTTLNLLIPVTDDSQAQRVFQKLVQTKGALSADARSASFRSGFIRAVLDKKYFLKEEGSNQLFFKLPLTYLIHNSEHIAGSSSGVIDDPDAMIEVTRTNPSVEAIGKKFADIFQDIINADRSKLDKQGTDSDDVIGPPVTGPAAIFPLDIYGEIASSVSFLDLVDNIQYESVLSFVSVLVTETVQRMYPSLDSTFDRTLALIKTTLMPFINVSKRQEDSNFYQKGNTMDSLGLQIPDVNIDMLMLILESLLKSLATMSDPTWRTPWFAPGPLTPIGIVAKLLDDSDSVDNVDQLKGKQSESAIKINNGLNCGEPDDS